MRLSSRRLLSRALVLLGGAAMVGLGCNPAASVNTIISQQLDQVLGQITQNLLLIRVVNQTTNDVQLDLLIDGVQQTLSCSGLLEVCDTALSTCATTIEAVQQRTLDAQGRFIGGRNFNGSEAFKFSQGDFTCGESTIIYKFTVSTAEAFVI